ncbi:MAG: LysR family transcriptional regulator [Ilumatobacteraceae bacterium]
MPGLRELEMRHLFALDAVATEGTFGRAAERLGYTQSAVSQQIASFERLVGGSLFDRRGGPRPVELTPLGEIVLEHAREILRRIDTVADDIDRFHAGDVGRLDIGTFQSISVAVLPNVIRELRRDHPGLDVRPIESDDEDVLVAKLFDGELDLTFMVGALPAELDGRVLYRDPFVVVAPIDAVDEGPMSVRRVASEPMIGQYDNACHRAMESGLRAAGCTPEYVFRTNDNSAVVAMVRAGMGMAVMPLLALDLNDTTVALRPLDPPLAERVISLVWRRDRSLSPAAERFIAIAAETFAGLDHRCTGFRPVALEGQRRAPARAGA